MAEETIRKLSDLYLKTIDFYQKQGGELEHVRQLLDIRLNQLALAYTTENRLPPESITVKTRIKTFTSFLKKMESLNKTDFEYPEDILYDLIGARVICWFLDDCRGIAQCITNSNFISVENDSAFNYIDNPKRSGYRGIHLHARIAYERLSAASCRVKAEPLKILCEIQVRTKLMDTWADLTHEFHYKAKGLGIDDPNLEKVLEAQSKRFLSEDESFVAIRNLYQKMIVARQP